MCIQVVIIGVGLVGFLFGQFLYCNGIDVVIFEIKSCVYVEECICVGVLE